MPLSYKLGDLHDQPVIIIFTPITSNSKFEIVCLQTRYSLDINSEILGNIENKRTVHTMSVFSNSVLSPETEIEKKIRDVVRVYIESKAYVYRRDLRN